MWNANVAALKRVPGRCKHVFADTCTSALRGIDATVVSARGAITPKKKVKKMWFEMKPIPCREKDFFFQIFVYISVSFQSYVQLFLCLVKILNQFERNCRFFFFFKGCVIAYFIKIKEKRETPLTFFSALRFPNSRISISVFNNSSLSFSFELVGTISQVINLLFVLPGTHSNILKTEKILQKLATHQRVFLSNPSVHSTLRIEKETKTSISSVSKFL